MITGHGDDSYRYDISLKADFSSNVWYDGIPPALIEHLQTRLKTVHHYPEPAAETLTAQMALRNNCRPNQVLVTNGSTEAFYLIAQAFAQHISTVLTPCFAEYADACRLHGHSVHYTRHHTDWQHTIGSSNLLWLGNPNNPDGHIFSPAEIKDVLTSHPHIIVIVDEAYYMLCYNYEPLTALLHEFDNLIIVRSFTKAFAIPGIRLGYMLGSENHIASIRKYLIPWSVNHLAQQAGLFILDHEQSLLPTPVRLKQEQETLLLNLENIPELAVIRSACNFCLVRLKKGDSAGLKDFLLQQHGVLIRDAANFKGLDNQYIRLALQSDKDNQLLIDGLKQYFATWT